MLDSSLLERARENVVAGHVIDFLVWVRSSFLAFVMTLGTVFLVSGLLIGDGVEAGMLVVLGISSFAYAVLGVVGLKLIGYN